MKKHIVRHALSFCMIFMFLCFAINCVAAERDNDGTQAASVNITPGFLQLVESHSEGGGDLLYAAGSVRNDSNQQCRDVIVHVNFYDKSGSGIGDGEDIDSRLAPHGVWSFKVLLDPEAKKWEIKWIKGDCVVL